VSAAAAARLALFALVHRLVASHQHLNRIPGILRVGVLAEQFVDISSTQISLRGASLTEVILERQGLAYTKLFRAWRFAWTVTLREEASEEGVLGGKVPYWVCSITFLARWVPLGGRSKKATWSRTGHRYRNPPGGYCPFDAQVEFGQIGRLGS
jgi:hypothetical protein